MAEEEASANEQFTADDWAAAMAEQTEAEGATATAADLDDAFDMPAAKPAAVFENLTPDMAGLSVDAAKNLEMVMDIPIQLTVELGRTKMPIRNLLQLAQGSVVELNELAGEPLDVFVNGCLVAQGEVVVVNEKFGIRLTDIITPSERLKKLR
jgi:flagellar motor switch protein FliN/FliY